MKMSAASSSSEEEHRDEYDSVSKWHPNYVFNMIFMNTIIITWQRQAEQAEQGEAGAPVIKLEGGEQRAKHTPDVEQGEA